MMLYDPKWEVEAKADPFALQNLVAWLERQPAEKTYCYESIGRCLHAQYFQSCGFPEVSAGGTYVRLQMGGYRTPISKAFQTVARINPMTFGAALERARALL